MILFLHNRYRVTGGEERAVEDLLWLVREHMGEEAELLERDSAVLGRTRASAALLRGGLAPDDVAAAVRRTGARAVSAHNVNPAFGWRGLAAARAAGARVVLHLHNYRLVCAVGTCFNSRGEDCVRCQGRDTLPGVRLGCRGSVAEAAVYGAALALWQQSPGGAGRCGRRAVALRGRAPARAAGAARSGARPRRAPRRARVRRGLAGRGRRARTRRLAPGAGEGRRARGPGLRAGGPAARGGRRRAAGRPRCAPPAARRSSGACRRTSWPTCALAAALALVPSRSAETFGLAAAEAMAEGIPVVATAVGALPDLVGAEAVVAPGDVDALAAAARARFGDETAGTAGLRRVRDHAAPDVVSGLLAPVYA